MEALITLDREYSVEWDDHRGQIKILSVWLVGNGKEVEVTEVMDGADMAHFHRELEEQQIAAAEMMNDEPPFKTWPQLTRRDAAVAELREALAELAAEDLR